MSRPQSSAKWEVVKYTNSLYFIWSIASILTFIMGIWAIVAGEFAWTLGLFMGSLAFAAHARLERMDSHRHMGGRTYVE